MPRGQMSEEGRKNIQRAMRKRWRKWRALQAPVKRHERRAEPLPVVQTPGTNGAIAELSVTLHIKGQSVQLTSEEAASVYDALGMVLHRHGLSAT